MNEKIFQNNSKLDIEVINQFLEEKKRYIKNISDGYVIVAYPD